MSADADNRPPRPAVRLTFVGGSLDGTVRDVAGILCFYAPTTDDRGKRWLQRYELAFGDDGAMVMEYRDARKPRARKAAR